MKNKLIYCDLIASNGIHSGFNIACVQMLMLAYPKICSIEFYSERNHARICQEQLTNNIIRWHTYNLYSQLGGGYKTPLRDLLSCYYVIKIFITSSKKDIIFFALSFPFAQYLIHLFQLFLRRNVYICQHGELEALVNKGHFQRNKFYYSLIKPLLRIGLVKYVILGNPIFKNVKQLFNKNSKVIIIDHPYSFSIPRFIIPNKNKPLIIGQIGCGDRGKGTQYLFEIAHKLQREIQNGLLIVKLVGKLSPELYSLDENLVQYHTRSVAPKDFENEILSLHYVLLLRDNDMGKATAFGTFFDTLKYRKPFLSLYNEYIHYYVKDYKMLNSFYNNIDEIINQIKSLLKSPYQIERYKDTISEIEQIQENLSLKNIAKSFYLQDQKLNEKSL